MKFKYLTLTNRVLIISYNLIGKYNNYFNLFN